MSGRTASRLSLIVRMRRSTGVERQQITWITYALALVAIGPAIAAELRFVLAQTMQPAHVVLWLRES